MVDHLTQSHYQSTYEHQHARHQTSESTSSAALASCINSAIGERDRGFRNTGASHLTVNASKYGTSSNMLASSLSNDKSDRRYSGHATSGYMQKKMRQAEDRLARNVISMGSGSNTRATSLLTSSNQNAGSFNRASHNNYSKGAGVSIYQRSNRDLDRCGTGTLDRKEACSSQLKQSGSSSNLNLRSSFNHLPTQFSKKGLSSGRTGSGTHVLNLHNKIQTYDHGRMQTVNNQSRSLWLHKQSSSGSQQIQEAKQRFQKSLSRPISGTNMQSKVSASKLTGSFTRTTSVDKPLLRSGNHSAAQTISNVAPGMKRINTLVMANDFNTLKLRNAEVKKPSATQPAAESPTDKSSAVKKPCQHTELISYKVHSVQFKSLLVPLTKRSGRDQRTGKQILLDDKPFGTNEAKSGERRNKERRLLEKLGKLALSCAAKDQEGVDHHADANVAAFTSERAKSSGRAGNRSGRLHSKGRSRVASALQSHPAQGNSSSDEERSTDGEETDPESPLCTDAQYLNSGSELRQALKDSRALVGDYVELKNCKRCGAMIFRDQSAAIKPDSEEFNADISPAQLLTKMFQDEARYSYDHFVKMDDAFEQQNSVAHAYLQQRVSLLERLGELSTKFKQRTKTRHIATELLDRYFLDKGNQSESLTASMTSLKWSVYLVTCFLIASKYDEIDDQLVFINDIQKHLERTLGMARSDVPSYEKIVECERELLKFFKWDLGFLMAIHFVEMYLANGVLFGAEEGLSVGKSKETAAEISAKCYELLEDMIKVQDSFKNQGYSSNQVASTIVYMARQEVLRTKKAKLLWPKELQLISRQTHKQVQKLASKYSGGKGRLLHRTEPFGDFSTIAGGPVLTKNHPSNANLMVEQKIGSCDLTCKKSNEGLTLNAASSILSPKPTNYEEVAREGHVGLSSDKISLDVDVPVAQIIIPTATNRRALQEMKPVGQNQEINVRQSYGVMPHAHRGISKAGQSIGTSALSDYSKHVDSRPSGGAAQQAVSGFSLKRTTIDNSKHVPSFRTKRRSELRNCSGAQQISVGASRFGQPLYDRSNGALNNGQRSAGKFSTSGQQQRKLTAEAFTTRATSSLRPMSGQSGPAQAKQHYLSNQMQRAVAAAAATMTPAISAETSHHMSGYRSSTIASSHQSCRSTSQDRNFVIMRSKSILTSKYAQQQQENASSHMARNGCYE